MKPPLFISTSRVPEHRCPVCHRRMDATTSVSELPEFALPKAGDISICAYCRTVNVFREDGSLRVATSLECEQLPDWALKILSDEP